ncbi:MAG TPA: sulfatase, partial [Planctomycetaceae bacterium]|nr:sulfatase [Planctomycetaceae bacterium]
MNILLRVFIVALLAVLSGGSIVRADNAGKPNVLFIPVDDLNHWVGHLGRNPQTKTPNIDRLARMGVTFTNAHCAAPVCNPSRAALLSGMRPGTTGVYDNGHPYELAINAEQSLVTQFRKAGYDTLGMGKLWHGGLGFPEQWTATGGREKTDNLAKGVLDDRSIGGIRFGILNAGDEAVPDTSIADYVIGELSKTHDKPFFLTAGFHKPHMPWNVPQKYFDMHPLKDIQLPPIKAGDLSDVPSAGIKMAKPDGDHRQILESGRWKEAVQAYLAAISYLDGQVGRLLDALESSPHRDNTIICLWGDHGWHLGEKEHWRKFALWEEATRAPFIWVVPGLTKAGDVCHRPVDFMSIYPTLCDLAGVPIPAHVEGKSIRSLLANPASTEPHISLTTFGRNNHALRDDRWRYIRYADGSEELYDHDTDPYEWTNLASLPEHGDLKAKLATHFPTVNNPEVKSKQSEKSDGKGGKKGGKQKQKQKPKATPVSLKTSEPRRLNVVFFV